MSYYYNKKQQNKEPFSSDGAKYDPDACCLYILSNRWVRKRLSEVTTTSYANAKAVLLVLAQSSSDYNTYASQAKLATMSGLSVKTIQRAIAGLRRVGLIITWHRYKKTNGETLRTTSQTFLLCFVKFCNWLRNQKTQLGNEINKLKSFLTDKSTGEILNYFGKTRDNCPTMELAT